jgi:hypothetical protein
MTLASHAIDAGDLASAETALAGAEHDLAGLADVDLRERSDLLAVRGKLAAARDDLPAAFAALAAAASRCGSPPIAPRTPTSSCSTAPSTSPSPWRTTTPRPPCSCATSTP